jgi:hypothetical protein
MVLSTEKQLIFELTRFKDFDKQKISDLLTNTKDYPWVLGQLLFNRMGGVAYFILDECKLLKQLNREFRNTLKSIYELNISKNRAFKQQLCELSTYFKDASFKYAFLKGSYLTSTLYPEGLRTSNDFDILINQKDITECSEILKNNGFIQGYYKQRIGIVPATRQEIITARMNRGETVPFLKESNISGKDIIEIDINFSLDFKAKNKRDIVSEILENIQSFQIENDKNLFTLSKEDFLIQLCVHLFKEATVYNWVEMQRDLSLYKFCDIYAYLLKYSNKSFIDKLRQRITFFKLEKECYYALKFCYEIYPNLENVTGFQNLMEIIAPSDLSYLNQIINPGKKLLYRYDMNFNNWFFCTERLSHLYEIKE